MKTYISQVKSWISMRLRVDLTSECLDEWVYLANSFSELLSFSVIYVDNTYR
jgi:hypothetical protein